MEMDNRSVNEFESGCYDFTMGVKTKLKQNQLNFILGQPGVGRNILTKAFLMRMRIKSPAKIVVFDEDSELELSTNLYDKYFSGESKENFMRNMLDDIYSQIRFREIGVKPVEMIYFINAQPDEKWVSKITKLTHNQYFSKLKTCIIWSGYLDKKSEWAKNLEDTNNIIIQKGKNGVEINGTPVQISEKDNVVTITTTSKSQDFKELEDRFNRMPLIKINTLEGNLLSDILKIRNDNILNTSLIDTLEDDFIKYFNIIFREEI